VCVYIYIKSCTNVTKHTYRDTQKQRTNTQRHNNPSLLKGVLGDFSLEIHMNYC
jgi:hypothetical protein